MTSIDHLILGVREAAEVIGVSRSTIERWAASGKLPPLRKMEGLTGGYVFEAGVVRRLAEERRLSRRAS